MVHVIDDACDYHWEWVEAFSKFGFNDGDGQVETYTVALALEAAGYTVKVGKWCAHNHLIYSISKDGVDYLPNSGFGFMSGYDHPSTVLPIEITELLNEEFPQTSLYQFP